MQLQRRAPHEDQGRAAPGRRHGCAAARNRAVVRAVNASPVVQIGFVPRVVTSALSEGTGRPRRRTPVRAAFLPRNQCRVEGGADTARRPSRSTRHAPARYSIRVRRCAAPGHGPPSRFARCGGTSRTSAAPRCRTVPLAGVGAHPRSQTRPSAYRQIRSHRGCADNPTRAGTGCACGRRLSDHHVRRSPADARLQRHRPRFRAGREGDAKILGKLDDPIVDDDFAPLLGG